jgi:phosphoribosyl 1,2-cyclic phosphate phosphodiesterase
LSITVEFLGTGTSGGVPMIACKCAVCKSYDSKDKRLRSSVLIKSSTTTVVIDTTPDFRTQMLRSDVEHIDAVLFTHSHKDHIAGLDDIRAFNFFSKKSIPIYANQETSEALQRDFYYAFAELKYPGIPEINLHTIGDKPFQVGDLFFQPFSVKHMHMDVTAFRMGDFTYITDANFIDEKAKKIIQGTEILVLNALRKEKHLSHFTLTEAIEMATVLNPRQTYFTHISHQMGFHQAISKELPKGIYLAHDGLKLHVNNPA